MKITKQQLSDIIYVPVIKDDLDRLASEARAALEAGTLEIEGYERVQWTRFDPKTFPPKNKDVLFTDGSGVAFGYMDENKRVFSWIPEPTHWRPLPNPPVETEEAK